MTSEKMAALIKVSSANSSKDFAYFLLCILGYTCIDKKNKKVQLFKVIKNEEGS